jgi:hypothetical protein
MSLLDIVRLRLCFFILRKLSTKKVIQEKRGREKTEKEERPFARYACGATVG